jgi:hypothetical protein
MNTFQLRRALDFVKASQNRDGGWGYRPGGASYVEPTAFCALALSARGDDASTGRAAAFLKTCQKGSGAIGISPGDNEGSWMAYAALLAFHALGAKAEEGRLKDWILGFGDASSRLSPAEIKAIREAYRYDASIQGWPWIAGTTGWVEPTALFIIALIRSGVAQANARIRQGVSLIVDRRVASGGWNFGNPYSKSHELEASLMSTALALAALGIAGYPEDQPAAAKGLRFLRKCLAGDVGTASLAWSILALGSYPSGSMIIPGAIDRLSGLQGDDGSFRRNLFETALVCLVLDPSPNPLMPPGRSK